MVTANELDAYPPEVRAAVKRFFTSPEDAYVFVGVKAAAERSLGLEQKETEDIATPLEARLATFEAELLASLDCSRVSTTRSTHTGTSSRNSSMEVVATLIALRGLWRCAPD